MNSSDRPSARFLLAVIDAGGTVPPALSLGAELVRRGHHVRGDPTIETSARSAGCAFSPWREAPHFSSLAEQTAMIAALEGGNPYQAFRAAKDYAGKAMTSRFARDVVSIVRDSPVDAILSDGLPGILIGAHATRRPTAALVPQTYVRPTPGLPLLGTGWSPGQGFLGKARDRIIPKVASRLLTPTLPRLNAVIERYELLPLDNVFELYDRCSRVLVMTSPSFDFSAPQLPANVRYVGPQLDDPDWAASAQWQRHGSEPLVLVATSSVYQDQVDLLERIAEGLRQLPVRAVLTTGRAVDPGEIQAGANVEVLQTAPHARVLREASAVVTHAGHGTVMKALAAGVPLVCIPMGRDQKDNSVRVLRLGAGIRLSKKSTPAQIAAAVTEILERPQYLAAARRFAEVLAWEAAHRPRAADEAESLVRL
ncbi:MAG TPA: nucleotide disphospho-sugar-binding domain-containing protein [Propionibacteriaceae bacterium]|nr:nucleotide disphospho-sugar-binding domain-containing protein [Propionibacteriaceae bacterium]